MNNKKLALLFLFVAICVAPVDYGDQEISTIFTDKGFSSIERHLIPDDFQGYDELPDSKPGDQCYISEESVLIVNPEQFTMISRGHPYFEIKDPFGYICRFKFGLQKALLFQEFLLENISDHPLARLSHLFMMLIFTEEERQIVLAGPFWNIFNFKYMGTGNLITFDQYRDVVEKHGEAFIDKAISAKFIEEIDRPACLAFHDQVLLKMDEIAAFVEERTDFFPIFMSLAFGQTIYTKDEINDLLNDDVRKGHEYIPITFNEIPQRAANRPDLIAFHDLLTKFGIPDEAKKAFIDHYYYIKLNT